jgi:hypothetical protein
MKIKSIILCIIAISILSCSDDNEKGTDYSQSYLNGTYQNYSEVYENKNPFEDGENYLILKYNDNELKSKEVSFYTSDHKIGKITFSNIINNEEETIISNIALVIDEEKGGFSFEGLYNTKNSKKVTYSGHIVVGTLSLYLNDEE